MKKYVQPKVNIFYLCDVDIITYSSGKDNDVEDDNWFDD